MPNVIAKELAEIHAGCLEWATPDKKELFTRDKEKLYARQLQDDTFIYAKNEHGLVAGNFKKKEEIYLWIFAVILKQQGKGYGRALLKEFIAKATDKGAKIISLCVDEKKGNALHLFKEFGFKPKDDSVRLPHDSSVVVIPMRLDINNSYSAGGRATNPPE